MHTLLMPLCSLPLLPLRACRQGPQSHAATRCRSLVVGDSHPNHQTLTKYFIGNVVAKAMIHDQH